MVIYFYFYKNIKFMSFFFLIFNRYVLVVMFILGNGREFSKFRKRVRCLVRILGVSYQFWIMGEFLRLFVFLVFYGYNGVSIIRIIFMVMMVFILQSGLYNVVVFLYKVQGCLCNELVVFLFVDMNGGLIYSNLGLVLVLMLEQSLYF